MQDGIHPLCPSIPEALRPCLQTRMFTLIAMALLSFTVAMPSASAQDTTTVVSSSTEDSWTALPTAGAPKCSQTNHAAWSRWASAVVGSGSHGLPM